MTTATDECPIGYGSATGYKAHGCRCRPCKDAVAAYQRHYTRRRGYNSGQHLQRATDNQAQTARNRLIVLNHMGWALDTIAHAGSIRGISHLSNILAGTRRPSRHTAHRINTAWDTLTSRQTTYQRNPNAGKGRGPRTTTQKES